MLSSFLLCSLLPRGKAEDASNWRIVLGKHQLKRAESAERIFPVKRIYRHEHFRYPAHSELDYDIALVKAATDIQTSNFIRYACLPRKEINLKPGHYCWVTGWGDTRGKTCIIRLWPSCIKIRTFCESWVLKYDGWIIYEIIGSLIKCKQCTVTPYPTVV